MKILAVSRDLKPFPKDPADILRREAQVVWALQQEGALREIYFVRGGEKAVLVLEAASAEEGKALLARLPLVAEGYIEFELDVLMPYPGFARLFRDGR
jgi:muconolactone delta-isomerase